MLLWLTCAIITSALYPGIFYLITRSIFASWREVREERKIIHEVQHLLVTVQDTPLGFYHWNLSMQFNFTWIILSFALPRASSSWGKLIYKAQLFLYHALVYQDYMEISWWVSKGIAFTFQPHLSPNTGLGASHSTKFLVSFHICKTEKNVLCVSLGLCENSMK